jgi:hypothetical protein
LFYPETSNKTLEDIDFLFVGGASGLPYGSQKTDSSIDIEKGGPNHKESEIEDTVSHRHEKTQGL